MLVGEIREHVCQYWTLCHVHGTWIVIFRGGLVFIDVLNCPIRAPSSNQTKPISYLRRPEPKGVHENESGILLFSGKLMGNFLS